MIQKDLKVLRPLENTNVDQWSYIPARENPADDASRGLNAEWESSNSRWSQGPSLL